MNHASRAADQHEVAETIRSLYRSLGNRAAFDAHLDPAITIWESDAPSLIEGLSGLDALRDERAARARPASSEDSGGEAAQESAPSSVAPEDIRVDSWDEAAVARFVLRAHHPSAEDEIFRVTDVLTCAGGRWRIMHHHAERHR